MLGDVRFERETSLFRFDPCLINGATQLFVCRSRRRADLPVQRRHEPSECRRCGIVVGKKPSLLFTVLLHVT